MMQNWTKPQIYDYCRILYARKLKLDSKFGNSEKAVKTLQSVQLRLEMALYAFNEFKPPVAQKPE